MLLECFAVHDSKAEAFLQPFFSPTKGLALRSFVDACNDQSHNFYLHAEDFTLFHVGSFNQSSGMFLEFDSPSSLGNALTFITEDRSDAPIREAAFGNDSQVLGSAEGANTALKL